MMTSEEVFWKILAWEENAGESFLDYFDGNLNPVSFMMWARGRKYLTDKQFRAWERALGAGAFEAESAMSYVYDSSGYEIPYAVVSEPDWTAEGENKAYMILAEFISGSITYEHRLVEFLEGE